MSNQLDRKSILKLIQNNHLTEDDGLRLISKSFTHSDDQMLMPGQKKSVDDIMTVYYQKTWENFPILSKQLQSTDLKNLLVFDFEDQLCPILYKQDTVKIIPVKSGTSFSEDPSGSYTIDPTSKEDYKGLFSSLKKRNFYFDSILFAGVEGLVSLKNLEGASPLDHYLRRSILPLILLTQALIDKRLKSNVKLLYFYKKTDTVIDSIHAAVIGFARTVRQEIKHFFYKTVAFSHSFSDANILLDKLSIEFQSQEDSVYYTNESRFSCFLKEIDLKQNLNEKNKETSKGAYLITGGAGALGFLLAKHFLKKGIHPIVLTGRSSLSADLESKLNLLCSKGTDIIYLKADISKREEVQRLINTIRSRFGHLSGIIHSAGVIRDSLIKYKNQDEVDAVLAPKIYGTVYLDELTKDEPLEFFTLFSSVAAITGNTGQCDYTYANSFMDHFAELRNSWCDKGKRFGKTLALNWPMWEEGTMRMTQEDCLQMMQDTGLQVMPTNKGLASWDKVSASELSQCMVLYGQPDKIRHYFKPFQPDKEDKEEQNENTVTHSILKEKMESFLKSTLAEVAGLSKDQIHLHKDFDDYGMDSLLIKKFTQKIEKILGRLPKTLLLDHHNLEDLADHLFTQYQAKLSHYFGSEIPQPSPSERSTCLPSYERFSEKASNKVNHTSSSSASEEPIAIVGLGGRYPGAPDLETFWQNLKTGQSFIKEIPPNRWNNNDYYDPDPGQSESGKIYCKWGGFLEDVDKFDPLFFNITPLEAKFINPEERLMLEVVWSAMESGGHIREVLAHQNVGVFMGVTSTTYTLLGMEQWNSTDRVPIDNTYFSLPNRISHFFNFIGPSLAVDTACASSLTAIHLACESIRRGECMVAVAGGVNLYLHPSKYLRISQGRLGSTQRRELFEKGGDGFIPGEGAGAVFLKPLSQAIKEEDFIYGVIKASGVSHSGKSSGYLLPSPDAQASLLTKIIKKANIEPESLTYLEMQAVGSEMVDVTEWTALNRAYTQLTQTKEYCALGSLKPSIGHLEAASGIAQLTKVLLQMIHGQIAPNHFASETHEDILVQNTPFYFQKELKEWERSKIKNEMKTFPRRAGINSFGAGGVQAHLIIEEYLSAQKNKLRTDQKRETSYLILLSAKDEERLEESANNLYQYLFDQAPFLSKNLADIAYTLQIGREAFEVRLAFIVNDYEELVKTLNAYINKKTTKTLLFSGKENYIKVSHSLSDEKDFIRLYHSKNFIRLAELWTNGRSIDWKKLNSNSTAKRIPLPTYPFEKLCCWIKDNKDITKPIEYDNISDKTGADASSGKVVSDYYDQLVDSVSKKVDEDEAYLIFAPFEKKIEGFSWLLSFSEKSKYAVEVKFSIAKQKECKSVIFRLLDFSKTYQVLDIGCGLSTDMINLAQSYPHVTCDGYTITPKQAELGQERIKEKGLDHRIRVFCRDSSKEPFPGHYDLIMGFEVTFHIENKQNLFNNIARHLNPEGLLVLADVLANTVTEIDMPQIGQFTSTQEQFSQVLADNGLKVVSCVDSGTQISNFLYDAHFEETLGYLGKTYPEMRKMEAEHRGWNHFGQALEMGLFRYVLLTIQKANPEEDKETLFQINQERFSHSLSYPEVLNQNPSLRQTTALSFESSRAAHYNEESYNENVQKQAMPQLSTDQLSIDSKIDDSEDEETLIEQIEEQVLQIAAKTLGIPSSRINPQARFNEYGVGSLQGLKLLDSINRTLGLKLKMKVIYNHSSIHDLSVHIATACRQVSIDKNKLLNKVSSGNVVADYYDQLVDSVSKKMDKDEAYLIFAPFEKRIEGFSWLLSFSEKSKYAAEVKFSIAKQKECKSVIFRLLDFSKTYQVLDIGCGLSTDMINLAQSYPHITCDGYTITPKQAELGQEHVKEKSLDHRVRVFCRDSSKEPFPGHYDLIMGFEVTFHIKNKQGLFNNIAKHLNPEGFLVLADVLANTVTEIDIPQIGQFTSTQEQFSQVLADNGLKVISCVDSGTEISNFLYDAHFEETLDYLGKTYPEMRKMEDEHRGWNHFGQALEMGLFRYVLLTIQKAKPEEDKETLFKINQERFRHSLSYPEVLNKNPSLRQTTALSFESSRATHYNEESHSENLQKQATPYACTDSQIDNSEDKEIFVEQIEKQALQIAAKTLGIPSSRINPRARFNEYGVGSLQGLKLLDSINRTLGLTLKMKVIYNHSSIHDLSVHIATVCRQTSVDKNNLLNKTLPPVSFSNEKQEEVSLSKQITPPRSSSIYKSQKQQRPEQDIAVIGMSGRFPGARDLQSFWENLANGVDSITEVPETRWNIEQYYHPDPQEPYKSYSKWGGFLDEADLFDASFFNISPTEAQYMDPQQRLFLETCWNTLEDAGYSSESLNNIKCGVYVGLTGNHYSGLIKNNKTSQKLAHQMLGNTGSILAARISYFLNLKGAAVTLDTACSSSLVAVHLASNALRNGEAEMALAGGVTLYLGEQTYVMMSKAGILSPTGKCRTFDNRADGIVVGEGVGAVALKTVSRALEDGDFIYGVIKASGTNQDGKTNGITAPSVDSQKALELEIYDRYNIHPESISYVEAHGTGTKLGDPIELEALTEAFHHYTKQKQYCPIGSVKSNIGHTTGAAGIAGLIKILLALKHKKIPPSLHFHEENQHIPFKDSPFYVNTQLKNWESTNGNPCRAALSSFGFSGTNAHLVIEEAPTIERQNVTFSSSFLICLSAKEKNALERKVKELARWLEKERQLSSFSENNKAQDETTLNDISYTLLCGRTHFAFRYAFVVTSLDELKEKINIILQKNGFKNRSNDKCILESPENTTQVENFKVRPALKEMSKDLLDTFKNSNAFDKQTYQNKLLALGDLYTQGYDLEWRLLFKHFSCRKKSLPTYPFSGKSYWIEGISESKKQDSLFHKNENRALNSERTVGKDFSLSNTELQSFFYEPKWVVSQETKTEGLEHEEGNKTYIAFYPSKCADYKTIIPPLFKNDQSYLIQLTKSNHRHAQNEWDLEVGNETALSHCIKTINDISSPGSILCFYFFCDFTHQELTDLQGLKESEDYGVLSLFRLIKALQKLDFAEKALELKVITQNVHLITPDESISPFSAAILGLTRSIARTYPQWKVTAVDVDLNPCLKDSSNAETISTLFHSIEAETAQPYGEGIALRNGQRYQRTLQPTELSPVESLPFKPKGVYLIVGGAGGIGLTLANYLAEKVQARLVLIGRSALRAGQKEKIIQIEDRGGEVLYLQADASDISQMSIAIEKAKAQFGTINGVIHSAVIAQGKSLVDMDEDTFSTSLDVKTSGSVILYHLFHKESLDFMLFFSSIESFLGGRLYSGYASGCAFKDAFVQAIGSQANYPIRTINWGYWESEIAIPEFQKGLWNVLGADSQETFDQRLGVIGFKSITVQEGMETIARVLVQNKTQIVAVKAEVELIKQMGCKISHKTTTKGSTNKANPTTSLFLNAVKQATLPSLSEKEEIENYNQAFDHFEALSRLLLLRTFQAMGVFLRANEQWDINALREKLQIIPAYYRLYPALLSIIEEGTFIQISDQNLVTTEKLDAIIKDGILQALEAKRDALLAEVPALKAHIDLIWSCVPHYPAILKGNSSAADIIFPNASMERVEGIYKNNPAADYFNRQVALSIRTYIETTTDVPKVNIAEIGSGTGGTSKIIFSIIQKYANRLHYRYTDISKAFLIHGKRDYGIHYSFIDFSLLDIEKDISTQGYEPESFDILVATNVLHATQNIRNTLRNAKALLKPGGWLILNETTELFYFSTLTVGLLKGWWLFNDEENRLPGSPLVHASVWEKLLQEEGFGHVLLLGSADVDAQYSSQHVIISQNVTKAKITRLQKNQSLAALPEQESVPFIKEGQLASNRKSQTNKTEVLPIVKKVIIKSLAEVLEIDVKEITPDLPYSSLGVDSILAVEIINKINDTLEVSLRSTDLFNYSTTQTLAESIINRFGNSLKLVTDDSFSKPSPKEKDTFFIRKKTSVKESFYMDEKKDTYSKKSQEALQNLSQEIAVVGMSGCFPKAQNVDLFWNNLVEGKNCIERVPSSRWNLEDVYDPNPQAPNKCYTQHGGFLSDIEYFDPTFFQISPSEARVMDPQQRLFLQEAWKALEDAGYTKDELDGKKGGVFVGCASSDYSTVLQEAGVETDAASGIGNMMPILSGRISYFLNLRGPNIAFDTACSSSLVAIHLACESIRSGTSDFAIAGGVSLVLSPGFHILLSKAGVLSPSGQCRAFDDKADGLVQGEAVGAIVLKPLEAALRDRNPVYGIIKGSGVNQDGKSNGITAPSAPSQAALIESVYRRFAIDPETISYVETHGTGTKLGDPIEIEALTEAFRKFTPKKQYCPIASVKSNIGHALLGAGISSVIKILLSLKHKKLAPSINFEQPNKHIDFSDSPFYVNTQLNDWKPLKESSRRAAVSGFGFSGTNCHLVIDEYNEKQPQNISSTIPQRCYLIVFSAKTNEALGKKIKDLQAWLEKQADAPSLENISYTLLCSRTHFEYRSALTVDSIATLKDKLRQLSKGQQCSHYLSGLKKNMDEDDFALKELGESLIKELKEEHDLSPIDFEKKLLALGSLYVKGCELRWDILFKGLSGQKISLPTYPFAREFYWPTLKKEIKDESFKENGFFPMKEEPLSTQDFNREKTLAYLKRLADGQLNVKETLNLL